MSDNLVPDDVLKKLSEFPIAKEKFENLPPSHKREYINYIQEAKRPETRARRINRMIDMLLKKG